MLNTSQISISTFSDAHWIIKFSVRHKNNKKTSPHTDTGINNKLRDDRIINWILVWGKFFLFFPLSFSSFGSYHVNWKCEWGVSLILESFCKISWHFFKYLFDCNETLITTLIFPYWGAKCKLYFIFAFVVREKEKVF